MRNNILLIYPSLGAYDKIIKDIPLSLLYVSRLVAKDGFDVTIVDQRIEKNWQERVKAELSKRPLLAGLSVMTGEPIKHALEISEFIRSTSTTPIVWGGIHPTIMPEQTVANEFIDMVIRGYGEETLRDLSIALSNKQYALKNIAGLTYKYKDKVVSNPDRQCFDYFSSSVNYDLIDTNKYLRFGGGRKYLSVFTSIGCPHSCAFCYNTPFDKNRWQPQKIEQAMQNLDLLINRFRPECLSFIDSDFFVDAKRVKVIFQEIKKRSWNIEIDFRGGRVNELNKLTDDVFSLMQGIGVRHIQIGVESGSQRILDIIDKKIKVEETIKLNNRLKSFPKLRPAYNFFSGIPTETIEDVRMSIDLIFRLLRDNSHSYISAFNHYTPYPGTMLFDQCIKMGLRPPQKLEDWVIFDETDFAKRSPWLSKRMKSVLNMAYVSSVFIDNKINNLFNSKKLKYAIIRLLASFYRPIAVARLKYLFTDLFFEKSLFKLFQRYF